MRRTSLWAALLVAVIVPVMAQDADDDRDAESRELKLKPNVMVTITIGDVEEQSGLSRRIYRMIARDRERAEMLMGWRTPIPTTSKSGETETEAPLTSYVYQNVGVTAQIEIQLLSDKRVLLSGQIEVSGAKDDPPGSEGEPQRPPLIGTFQQMLVVLLRENEALRVAEVPDPDGGSLYLELEVDILE